MIKLEHLTCKYDNTILEDINLSISQNKITYIIGQNGSGKSTLCNILSGLKKDFKGSLYINNKEITKKTPLLEMRKLIGMIFQNPNNQMLFTRVYDDIKFTLENMNTNKDDIDKIIKKSLEQVNLLDKIDANPYNLSGGEKQRLAIASILALNPKYIIFDEATSMLDINNRQDIYKLLKKLNKNNIGIICITNIMDELIFADEILVLDNKKIFKYTKEELFNNLNILKEHNLDIPFTLKIIDILKKKGISVNTEDEILSEVTKL